MNMEKLNLSRPNLDCDPPLIGEVGDVWYCPGCARKFTYIMMLADDVPVGYAWFTDETEGLV